MTELLREALSESTDSIRAVSRAAGVPHCSLLRFLAGTSLRLDMADRLAEHFGIVVRLPQRKARGKAKG